MEKYQTAVNPLWVGQPAIGNLPVRVEEFRNVSHSLRAPFSYLDLADLLIYANFDRFQK